MWGTKSKCWNVLSNSSGHYVVHVTSYYSTLMVTQESIYKWFHWLIVRQWVSLQLKLFLTKFCCLILFNKCWIYIMCQELCDLLGGQATLWSLLGNFPYNFWLNMGCWLFSCLQFFLIFIFINELITTCWLFHVCPYWLVSFASSLSVIFLT